MADEDLLRILEQGVEVWNQWRQKNPLFRRDLSNAKLFSQKSKKSRFMGLVSQRCCSYFYLIFLSFIFHRIRNKTLRKQHKLKEGTNYEET